MSTAEQIKIDYSACESLLRFVFSTTEIGGSSSLADWINTKPRDFDRKLWVKPKGQATHAVATRQTGGNAIPLDEVDWFKSPFVRAVNALHEPYPEMLRGRYHPNPTITEKCAVIYPVLQMYRKTEPMLRAKAMLDHIFDPPMVADGKGGKRPQRIWEAYGYEHDEWQNHADRKIWDDVRQKLRSLMRPAIEAWVVECRGRGLEVQGKKYESSMYKPIFDGIVDSSNSVETRRVRVFLCLNFLSWVPFQTVRYSTLPRLSGAFFCIW